MAGRKKSRAAPGSGTIRKRTVSRSGRVYTYWEARLTVGRDPGTGKQIQRSFTGKTQKEVREKLQAAAVAVNDGTYTAPAKITVEEWLDIWVKTYLGGVKPRTVAIYSSDIRNHIKPALGAVRLDALDTHTIQQFYNSLTLSPKTVKNIHGVLHSALKQATLNGYIRYNPSDACALPRVERAELAPLDERQIVCFLEEIKGHRFEHLFFVALFTGMREGELLGLTWDCVDFERGMITVNKQLQLHQEAGMDAYQFVPTKNNKARTITVARFILVQLRQRQELQQRQRQVATSAWEDTGLVFTDELGRHLTKSIVYRSFKRVAAKIGCPALRFHDLRHSYAVAAIRAGDDIKTVQGNLGHATAAFTLDVYGHVTEQMRQDSASRMDAFIRRVSNA